MSEPQGWEIDGFLDIRNGQLNIDGIPASDLAAEYGTPLFVFSEQRIRHNIDRLKKIADVIPCPLKICYAAKAMSTMGILRTVREAGIDIEVNSGGELWKALKAGFTGDQIIFNGTSKEVWEIEMAIQNDIYAIQVDSLYELSLIADVAARLDKSANVSLRLVPEIESGTHSGLQTALLTSKFGMMPDEALSAFAQYKDSPYVDLCGIHLHIGSQNPEPEVYSQALSKLFEQLVRIADTTGVKLKHVNIGGGFPVDYMSASGTVISKDGQQVLNENLPVWRHVLHHAESGGTPLPSLRDLVQHNEHQTMLSASYSPDTALKNAWQAAIAEVSAQDFSDVEILIEPGRSIIADAGVCLTTVRSAKERPIAVSQAVNDLPPPPPEPPLGGGEIRIGDGVSFGMYDIKKGFVDLAITGEHWLLTDAGFNILLSMETYKWYYHLISADRAGDLHDFPYKVAGPLCDGGDVYFDIEGEGRLPDYRLLPKDVRAGEVLALLNCGAYSLAQASQYNGRGLPAVVLIRQDGKAELIRKRDSFGDLINNDL